MSLDTRRNRRFWIDHVARWRRSGLSKAAYCEQQNLKPGSFYNWSREAVSELVANEPEIGSVEPDAVEFLPITLTPSETTTGQRIHVERAATTVSLPADLGAKQIHRWLSAIHQLHV